MQKHFLKTALFIITLCCFSNVAISYPPEIETKIQAVEQGLTTEVLQNNIEPIRRNIHDRMSVHHIPAVSIAVINEGVIEWAKAYNITDEGVTSKTLFQAASISKPVTAMLSLSMVESKQMSLDQNVNDVLLSWKIPESSYTETEKVTLDRLLSHTAGLTVHGFDGYDSSFSSEQIPTLLQILNGEKPANSDPVISNEIPGKTVSYSGGGLLIVQQMIEDISQQKFTNMADEKIFKPLHMNSSTFEFIWPETNQRPIAVGHLQDGTVVPGYWHIYPEKAAAALWTTPSDLASFVIEIANTYEGKSKKILSQKMVKEMLNQQPNSSFGLGLIINTINSNVIEFSHSGSNEGYRTYFVGFTGTKQGAVIMTNGSNWMIPEIIRSIADTYRWPKNYTYFYKIFDATNIDPSIYSKYVGEFITHHEIPMVVKLTSENDLFNISLPSPYPNSPEKKFKLTPQSETDYFSAEGDISIHFSTNDELLLNTAWGNEKMLRRSSIPMQNAA